MRLKFLMSLLLTFSFFACAKDQVEEGSKEALSQDQAEGSSDQNASSNESSDNNQASENSAAETPAAPPSDAPLSESEDVQTTAADAPLEGTGTIAGDDTEPTDTTDPLADAMPALPDAPAPEAPADSGTSLATEMPPVQAEPASAPDTQAAPDAAASAAAEAAAAPVPASRPASGRLVRYVMRDNTAIVVEPQIGSKQVGTLSKGDAVLIEDQGEFGKIGEGKFVSKKALSEKIIGRTKTSNPWK